MLLITRASVPLLESGTSVRAPCVLTGTDANETRVVARVMPATVPVPLSEIVAGVPEALVAIEIVALLAPAVRGAKRILRLQVLPAATVKGQSVPSWKFAAPVPVSVMPSIARGRVPGLVSITTVTGSETIFTERGAKATLFEESAIFGTLDVPERLIVAGDLGSSDATIRFALKVPAVCGKKRMRRLQL